MATATATYLNITDISLRFLLCKSKKVRLKEAVINKLFGKMKFTEEFWALRDVSFQVKSGERLGIIGSNGAGKTSLLKMIAGIYPPTKGQIEICGDIAPLLDLGAGFDTEISARENILLYGSFLGQEIDGMRQRTDQIIEFAGIEQFADTPIKYFSKGMLLRLGFSVATDIMPEILLIDEVFAGGDAEFQTKAKARMEELITSAKIMVMVSHNLSLIKSICTRVIWLKKGELCGDGDPITICDQYLASVKKPKKK